jgi:predicted PurR-regulated permease PerM
MRGTDAAAKWAVFFAAAGVVVYLCVLILRPFFGIAAWSTMLAITCYPLYRWFVKRTRRAALSAFITSALVVVAIVVPLLVVGAVAVNQLMALSGVARQALVAPDGISGRATAALSPVAQRVGLDAEAIVTWASAHADEWVAGAGQHTMSAAADLGGALLGFAFTAFAMFLLLRHGERLVAPIPDLLPFERTLSEALLVRIRDVVYASVHGVVTIAFIQGLLCGGMFWVLGIPAAALWGAVTVFVSVVPFVGTAAVWVPGTLYLLAVGAWPKALVLGLWGGAVVSSVDNLLRPRLVAGRVRLPGLPMFVAMLGGLQAFGALGIIAGPVLFTMVTSMFDMVRETQRGAAAQPGPAKEAARL